MITRYNVRDENIFLSENTIVHAVSHIRQISINFDYQLTEQVITDGYNFRLFQYYN